MKRKGSKGKTRSVGKRPGNKPETRRLSHFLLKIGPVKVQKGPVTGQRTYEKAKRPVTRQKRPVTRQRTIGPCEKGGIGLLKPHDRGRINFLDCEPHERELAILRKRRKFFGKIMFQYYSVYFLP